MAQSRDESSPSRIELVVLACLSQKKPPNDAELGDAIQQVAMPDESAEAARRRATELLAGLVRRAWVTGDDNTPGRDAQRKTQPTRKLTDSGKRVLRNSFQLSRTPTWTQVRDKHLPSLALGMAPGSELAKKVCTENGLIAAVLGARYGIRDAFTPMAVCDALIADLLGMPRGELTLDRIRAHALLRRVDRSMQNAPSPDTKGYATKLATWIASSAVGASGTPRKMSRALTHRWVCGETQPQSTAPMDTPAGKPAAASATSGSTAAAPVPPSGPGRTPPSDPETARRVSLVTPTSEPPRAVSPAPRTAPTPTQNLLEVVRDAIPRIGSEGRFGEKVYVSAIWRTIARDHKGGDLSLDHFKSWLVRANRDGWLVLARADLIAAMDAKQINESEINDRGATFHFVLDPRNGASISQRENHAR